MRRTKATTVIAAKRRYIVVANVGGLWFRGTGSWKETSYKLEIFSVSQSGSTVPANPADIYMATSSGTVGNIDLKSIYNFTANKTYLIKLTTYNDCDSDVMVQYINAVGSGEPPVDDGTTGKINNPFTPDPTELRLPNLNKNTTLRVEVAPNPAKGRINLSYESFSLNASEINLRIISLSGEEVFHLSANSISELPTSLSLDEFASGLYLIVLQNSQTRVSQKLVILE
jgi:hypothetical protein